MLSGTVTGTGDGVGAWGGGGFNTGVGDNHVYHHNLLDRPREGRGSRIRSRGRKQVDC